MRQNVPTAARRAGALAVLVAAALLGAAVEAGAGIPSPGASFVAPHVVCCPAGDSMLVVIARHLSGTPWAEGDLEVDFCGCPGAHLAVPGPGCFVPDTSACRVRMTPDLYGVVEFPLSAGGSCPGGSIRVWAAGVLLAIRGEPAWLDQNGDLKVDDADLAIVTSKLGSHDPSADFDGDGVVTAADVAILRTHLGHSAAPAAVPASGNGQLRPPAASGR